ncbi:hypothetical protein [Paraburkholderia humisilvae]|uniref:Uncharacterized protein n=1 Tax=Paraburkholderia humisilvae TaxID=627669 RepID=A0A6J5EVN8_9BURK|nr:hypothetical protein [Paraburkholderia humisilvae]CAB3770253.1 hypothetical protein LMG29542_06304 [Paraburkholderia humisilvae]
MKIKAVLLGLIAATSAFFSAIPASAETIDAQSHVSGMSAPDITPPFSNLKASASKAVKVPPTAVSAKRFQSLRTTRQTEFNAQDVAPPVAGCADIQVGSVYSATTAAVGFTDCFEFVTADATKYVGYVANLPFNEEHDAHLVQVNSDGSLTYLDDERDTSQNKIVQAIPGGPVRLLLLVDSQSGAGGASFLFQVLGTTGYDSYEPNDSILHPTQLTGFQLINGNLDSPSDVDYYAVTTNQNQTANLVAFTATTNTQTAQLETAPNTWATLTPGVMYTVTSSAGATLMMRVYDNGTTGASTSGVVGSQGTAKAATASTYSLRVSDAAGTAGFFQFLDTENISHLAPGGENVARTIVAGVAAWDHTGNLRLPPGEHVVIQVYDTNLGASPVLLSSTDGYTGDPGGNLFATLNIGNCQGGGTAEGQFQTTAVPADHYDITYNPNSFALAYLANNPPQQITPPFAGLSRFVHICSERYLGRY